MNIYKELINCAFDHLSFIALQASKAMKPHDITELLLPDYIRNTYYGDTEAVLYECGCDNHIALYEAYHIPISKRESELGFTYDSQATLDDNLKQLVDLFMIDTITQELQPVIEAIRQFGLANDYMPKAGVLHAAKAWLKSQYLSPTPQWKDK